MVEYLSSLGEMLGSIPITIKYFVTKTLINLC